MPVLKNLIGQRFNMLTVISKDPQLDSYKCRQWICQCDCGKIVKLRTGKLTSNTIKSCGCWRVNRRKLTANYNFTTTEFRSYGSMKTRCYNTNHLYYKHYGGRGIKVCDRWLNSFENFLADMGKKPSPKHSIERIDNNKGYSPENCKWATPIEQSNNKRTNIVVWINGCGRTVSEWAKIAGVDRKTVANRIKNGVIGVALLAEARC